MLYTLKQARLARIAADKASDITVELEKYCDYTVGMSTETREMSKSQWNCVGSYVLR